METTMDGLNLSRQAAGEARLYHVRNKVWTPATPWIPNLVTYDAAYILAQLLRGSPDGKNYSISAAYILFENNGGAPVSVPAFGRDDGKSFYDGLLTDPNQDYIRVAVSGVTLDSTDTTLYPDGNRLTVFAQTEGVVGVHGKTFSDTVSSRVFGGAVVAAPVFADQTQDLVYANFAWGDSDDQMIKLAGSQLGVTYRVSLL
jgi:hypothetical protein